MRRETAPHALIKPLPSESPRGGNKDQNLTPAKPPGSAEAAQAGGCEIDSDGGMSWRSPEEHAMQTSQRAAAGPSFMAVGVRSRGCSLLDCEAAGDNVHLVLA